MAGRKSWTEKLEDNKNLPRVERITGKLSRAWGPGTVVIPAPRQVDELMRKVPEGKIVTINEIRAFLARKHNATICCPITPEFSHESLPAPLKSRTTPYWRTPKVGGVINEKYPFGVEEQKRILEKEGHKIEQKGKEFVVVDYEKSLARL